MINYVENNKKQEDYKETKKEDYIERITSLENENKNLKKEIGKLIYDNNLLRIVANGGDISKIKEIKELNMAEEKFEKEKNLIRINSELGKIIDNNKQNNNIEFKEFYDVIIDIKSIKDISKGWEIKMSKRAKKEMKIF